MMHDKNINRNLIIQLMTFYCYHQQTRVRIVYLFTRLYTFFKVPDNFLGATSQYAVFKTSLIRPLLIFFKLM
jgi:hypothetical protein